MLDAPPPHMFICIDQVVSQLSTDLYDNWECEYPNPKLHNPEVNYWPHLDH